MTVGFYHRRIADRRTEASVSSARAGRTAVGTQMQEQTELEYVTTKLYQSASRTRAILAQDCTEKAEAGRPMANRLQNNCCNLQYATLPVSRNYRRFNLANGV